MQRVRLKSRFFDGATMHEIGIHEFEDGVKLPSSAMPVGAKEVDEVEEPKEEPNTLHELTPGKDKKK